MTMRRTLAGVVWSISIFSQCIALIHCNYENYDGDGDDDDDYDDDQRVTWCDNEKDGGWCGLVCHATVVASVPHLSTAKNKHSPDINKTQIHPAQKTAMI